MNFAFCAFFMEIWKADHNWPGNHGMNGSTATWWKHNLYDNLITMVTKEEITLYHESHWFICGYMHFIPKKMLSQSWVGWKSALSILENISNDVLFKKSRRLQMFMLFWKIFKILHNIFNLASQNISVWLLLKFIPKCRLPFLFIWM